MLGGNRMAEKTLERILVTGAAGQIGSELIPALCEKEDTDIVVATVLNDKEKKYLEDIVKSDKLSIEILDVRNKDDFDSIAKENDINGMYHLAGILSAKGEENPYLACDVNVNGLLNALEVARKYKIKTFWASSIAAFGPDTPKEKTPQNPPMHPTTMYGLNKLWGEQLCEYYAKNYDVDIRSVRFPGIISYKTLPGGGTTDYAVQIFYDALKKGEFTCPLDKNTRLPMMYMPDAIKGMIDIMNAPKGSIKVRTSYNIGAVDFTPEELESAIKNSGRSFKMKYEINKTLQRIADSWVDSVDDSKAREDWGWNPEYDILATICCDMLYHLSKKLHLEERIIKY